MHLANQPGSKINEVWKEGFWNGLFVFLLLARTLVSSAALQSAFQLLLRESA